MAKKLKLVTPKKSLAKKTVKKLTKDIKKVTPSAKKNGPVVTRVVDVKPPVAATGSIQVITTAVPRFDPEETTVKSAVSLAGQVALMKVDTQEQAIEATRVLVTIKGLINGVTEKRVSLTKPLKDTAKRIEAMFKPTLDRLEEADRNLRNKVLTYRAEAQRTAAAQSSDLMEKAVEAQDSGDNESALALATQAQAFSAPAAAITVEEGSMSARKPWDFEVVDLGSVPHEYFTLDPVKVRAAIRSQVRDIAGLRIFQKDTLAISAPKLDVVGEVA